MRLDKNLRTNDSIMILSEADERVSMQINDEASAMIVNRLTDMYTRPIEATVRELMSNAIDSVKRADSKMAIKVIMPSVLNSSFTVEDFGEGMSRDTIREVYSQYGASTKSTDLDQVGAYGLGAKSPLSYCSQFTVESTKDGLTTELIVSSEDDGNYTRIVGTENTGKPNGTKVVIPVKSSDIDGFQDAIETYRKFTLGVTLDFVNINNEDEEYILDKAGKIPIPSISATFSLQVYSTASTEQTIKAVLSNNRKRLFGYFLSGWDYTKTRYSNGYNYGYHSDAIMMVELVPGIVDFSSSRDEITENKRYEDLKSTVDENADEVFADYIQKAINEEEISSHEVSVMILHQLRGYNSNEDKEYLSELLLRVTDLDGIPLYDEVKSDGEKDIISIFARIRSYGGNKFYTTESLRLTDETTVIGYKEYDNSIKGHKEENMKGNYRGINIGIIPVANWGEDSIRETVVVCEADEKDIPALINRSSNWVKRKNGDSDRFCNRFMLTKMTEEEFKGKLAAKGISFKAEYLTVDEYKGKSSQLTLSSSSSSDVCLQVYKLGVLDSLETYTKGRYYSSDLLCVPVSESKLDADKHKKLLFVVPNKVNWTLGDVELSELIKYSEENGEISGYVSFQTAIDSKSVEVASNKFDRVLNTEEIKYRSAQIQEKMNAVSALAKKQTITIDKNSPVGRLVVSSKTSELMNCLDALQRRLRMRSHGEEEARIKEVLNHTDKELEVIEIMNTAQRLNHSIASRVKFVLEEKSKGNEVDSKLEEIALFTEANKRTLSLLDYFYSGDIEDPMISYIINEVSKVIKLS